MKFRSSHMRIMDKTYIDDTRISLIELHLYYFHYLSTHFCPRLYVLKGIFVNLVIGSA